MIHPHFGAARNLDTIIAPTTCVIISMAIQNDGAGAGIDGGRIGKDSSNVNTGSLPAIAPGVAGSGDDIRRVCFATTYDDVATIGANIGNCANIDIATAIGMVIGIEDQATANDGTATKRNTIGGIKDDIAVGG